MGRGEGEGEGEDGQEESVKRVKRHNRNLKMKRRGWNVDVGARRTGGNRKGLNDIRVDGFRRQREWIKNSSSDANKCAIYNSKDNRNINNNKNKNKHCNNRRNRYKRSESNSSILASNSNIKTNNHSTENNRNSNNNDNNNNDKRQDSDNMASVFRLSRMTSSPLDVASSSLVEYQLVAMTSLDRERHDSYTLHIACQDGGRPSMSSLRRLHVQVTRQSFIAQRQLTILASAFCLIYTQRHRDKRSSTPLCLVFCV